MIAPASRSTRIADLAFRIAGGVVGVWAAGASAAFEAFLVPLRVGGYRFPVSVLLAILGNLLLVWYTRWVTGSRAAALAPGLTWFVVMIILSGGTNEGDAVLLANDGVAIALLLCGSAATAIGAYFAVVPRVTPHPRRTLPPAMPTQTSPAQAEPAESAEGDTGAQSVATHRDSGRTAAGD